VNQPLKITICDDSPLARRQLSRAIKSWDAEVSLVENGDQAIEAISQGKAQLLFLDLNMPVMDGYQVLQKIREQNLKTIVIVVSGDVQKKAMIKVKELGAIAFITKPIKLDKLHQIIDKFGLLEQLTGGSNTASQAPTLDTLSSTTQEERFQEIANIAMGNAAERLSVLLDTFINLSIPDVNTIAYTDLYMMIKGSDRDFSSSISQGFVGEGICGESILIVDKTGLPHISQLLGFPSEIDEDLEKDILVDLAGLLSSSFLKAFFQQIGIQQINQGIPAFLDYKGQLDHLKSNSETSNTLAIEVTYSIPSHEIYCDLLLIFTLDSIEPMNQRSELYSWTL